MAKLLISSQILENYGSEDNPFWKAKGGEDYVVKNFTDFNRVNQVVHSLRNQIEIDHAFCQEFIRSWEIVEDDFLTDFERSQLEYEGRIDFPVQELRIAA